MSGEDLSLHGASAVQSRRTVVSAVKIASKSRPLSAPSSRSAQLEAILAHSQNLEAEYLSETERYIFQTTSSTTAPKLPPTKPGAASVFNASPSPSTPASAAPSAATSVPRAAPQTEQRTQPAPAVVAISRSFSDEPPHHLGISSPMFSGAQAPPHAVDDLHPALGGTSAATRVSRMSISGPHTRPHSAYPSGSSSPRSATSSPVRGGGTAGQYHLHDLAALVNISTSTQAAAGMLTPAQRSRSLSGQLGLSSSAGAGSSASTSQRSIVPRTRSSLGSGSARRLSDESSSHQLREYDESSQSLGPTPAESPSISREASTYISAFNTNAPGTAREQLHHQEAQHQAPGMSLPPIYPTGSPNISTTATPATTPAAAVVVTAATAAAATTTTTTTTSSEPAHPHPAQAVLETRSMSMSSLVSSSASPRPQPQPQPQPQQQQHQWSAALAFTRHPGTSPSSSPSAGGGKQHPRLVRAASAPSELREVKESLRRLIEVPPSPRAAAQAAPLRETESMIGGWESPRDTQMPRGRSSWGSHDDDVEFSSGRIVVHVSPSSQFKPPTKAEMKRMRAGRLAKKKSSGSSKSGGSAANGANHATTGPSAKKKKKSTSASLLASASVRKDGVVVMQTTATVTPPRPKSGIKPAISNTSLASQDSNASTSSGTSSVVPRLLNSPLRPPLHPGTNPSRDAVPSFSLSGNTSRLIPTPSSGLIGSSSTSALVSPNAGLRPTSASRSVPTLLSSPQQAHQQPASGVHDPRLLSSPLSSLVARHGNTGHPGRSSILSLGAESDEDEDQDETYGDDDDDDAFSGYETGSGNEDDDNDNDNDAALGIVEDKAESDDERFVGELETPAFTVAMALEREMQRRGEKW